MDEEDLVGAAAWTDPEAVVGRDINPEFEGPSVEEDPVATST